MFFNDLFTHFFKFSKSNWSDGYGHTETGSGAKKRVVLSGEFFHSKFKARVSGRCFDKSLLSYQWFFVQMRQFDIDFRRFSTFWSIFFKMGFPMQSRSSFCLVNFLKIFCLVVRRCFYFLFVQILFLKRSKFLNPFTNGVCARDVIFHSF